MQSSSVFCESVTLLSWWELWAKSIPFGEIQGVVNGNANAQVVP